MCDTVKFARVLGLWFDFCFQNIAYRGSCFGQEVEASESYEQCLVSFKAFVTRPYHCTFLYFWALMQIKNKP